MIRDATPAKLDALIAQAAAGVSPRDTFVFYAAARGYSVSERYYLIPQDFQGGVNPEALKALAIRRPVLTAAASGKPALEGYKGHGVFTYALMEALHKGDSNNNSAIELTELVAHAEKRTPELVVELDAHGGVVKGVAVMAPRGAGGSKQSAHFGSTSEDFALTGRLP